MSMGLCIHKPTKRGFISFYAIAPAVEADAYGKSFVSVASLGLCMSFFLFARAHIPLSLSLLSLNLALGGLVVACVVL